MNRQLSRGVEGSRRSEHRARPWSRLPLATIVFVVAVSVALSGCDKPPKFSDLINGKKEEKPAPAPQVAQTQTPTPAPPRREPPKEPEKPKRSPQEAKSEFDTSPPEKRNNQQLIDMAASPDTTDQFNELNLSSANGINDVGMAALPKFEKVEKLTIDGCQYTNGALANIAKMKGLTSLSMHGGPVNDPTHNCDAGMAAIKDMHQLTSLSIESSSITPKGLAHIATMTWLESLNVARTRFNDDNLEMLAPLVNLKELNISYTYVSDNGFRFLLPFTQLEKLRFAKLPIRGDGLLAYSRTKGRPNLRELTMFEIAGLELTGYQGIYNFKKSLEWLDVGQSALTDQRFIDAVIPCTKLECLLVHENPSLGDGGVQQIYKLKNLKRLYFYKNPAVTDASIKALTKLRKMESITINACSVSEKGAKYLKKNLPKECEVVYNYKRVE
jgi:hypothetical protein